MQNSTELKKIIVDTFAWIEYFRGSKEGLIAKKYIDGTTMLFTPAIVIAELSDKYRREEIKEWQTRKRFIKLKSRILPLEDSLADAAGELKQILRKVHKDVGLADAIVVAHSVQIGAFILTGDKHLSHLKNCISVNN